MRAPGSRKEVGVGGYDRYTLYRHMKLLHKNYQELCLVSLSCTNNIHTLDLVPQPRMRVMETTLLTCLFRYKARVVTLNLTVIFFYYYFFVGIERSLFVSESPEPASCTKM